MLVSQNNYNKQANFIYDNYYNYDQFQFQY